MSQQDSGFGEHGKRWTAHDRRALTEGIKATKDHRAGLKTTTDHAQTIHDWIMVTYPAFDRTVEAVSRRLGAEFDSQARLERRAAKANAKEAREELEALKTLLQAKVINEKEHAEKLAAVEDELKTYETALADATKDKIDLINAFKETAKAFETTFGNFRNLPDEPDQFLKALRSSGSKALTGPRLGVTEEEEETMELMT